MYLFAWAPSMENAIAWSSCQAMEALYNDILEGSLSNLIMELIILVKPYSSFLVESHECNKIWICTDLLPNKKIGNTVYADIGTQTISH